MTDMSRRAFITGVVGSVAAGALIVEASDADVARFGVGNQVGVLGPEKEWLYSGVNEYWPVKVGDMLYDNRGKVVGVVQSLTTQSEANVTRITDNQERWVPGRMRLRADVEVFL
jgi:hypothetical protein